MDVQSNRAQRQLRNNLNSPSTVIYPEGMSPKQLRVVSPVIEQKGYYIPTNQQFDNQRARSHSDYDNVAPLNYSNPYNASNRLYYEEQNDYIPRYDRNAGYPPKYENPSMIPRYRNNSYNCDVDFSSEQYYISSEDGRYYGNYRYGMNSSNDISFQNDDNIKVEITERKNDEFLNLNKLKHGIETRTAVMLRNIPNRYSECDLSSVLDSICQGKYTITHMPHDVKSKRNLGYAFIKFNTIDDLINAYTCLEGCYWPNSESKKVCRFSYAHVQASTEENFKKSPTLSKSSPHSSTGPVPRTMSPLGLSRVSPSLSTSLSASNGSTSAPASSATTPTNSPHHLNVNINTVVLSPPRGIQLSDTSSTNHNPIPNSYSFSQTPLYTKTKSTSPPSSLSKRNYFPVSSSTTQYINPSPSFSIDNGDSPASLPPVTRIPLSPPSSASPPPDTTGAFTESPLIHPLSSNYALPSYYTKDTSLYDPYFLPPASRPLESNYLSPPSPTDPEDTFDYYSESQTKEITDSTRNQVQTSLKDPIDTSISNTSRHCSLSPSVSIPISESNNPLYPNSNTYEDPYPRESSTNDCTSLPLSRTPHTITRTPMNPPVSRDQRDYFYNRRSFDQNLSYDTNSRFDSFNGPSISVEPPSGRYGYRTDASPSLFTNDYYPVDRNQEGSFDSYLYPSSPSLDRRIPIPTYTSSYYSNNSSRQATPVQSSAFNYDTNYIE
ncbi:hypothetical protein WA158_001924 [Blastocystis sp. Blastoise]